MNRGYLLLFALLCGGQMLIAACSADDAGYRVINQFPHDANAYTQGLLFHDGMLYESTGLNGRSSLRKVDLVSGKVLQQLPLAQQYFGEGLALADGVLVQLTWRSGKAFVYHSTTFKPLRTFSYQTQGWGLTYDGESLIMSDGSHRLYFRDPASFRTRKTIDVTDQGKPVPYLNELEYIAGEVWANVYQSDDIVLIDPASGEVKRRINFSGLLKPEDRNGHEDVLNGIAHDAVSGRLFITGKLYSYVYEIALP